MRELDTVVRPAFDAVIACDNALPHLLGDDDLDVALGAIARVLAARGGALLSFVHVRSPELGGEHIARQRHAGRAVRHVLAPAGGAQHARIRLLAVYSFA